MGHSNRPDGFVNNKNFRVLKDGEMLDHNSTLKEFSDSINKKHATKLARMVAPHMIAAMPNGPVKLPIYTCATIAYDLYQSKDVNKFTKDKSAEYIAQSSWEIIENKTVEKGVNKSLVKYCEPAYKKTMQSIVIKGSGALL